MKTLLLSSKTSRAKAIIFFLITLIVPAIICALAFDSGESTAILLGLLAFITLSLSLSSTFVRKWWKFDFPTGEITLYSGSNLLNQYRILFQTLIFSTSNLYRPKTISVNQVKSVNLLYHAEVKSGPFRVMPDSLLLSLTLDDNSTLTFTFPYDGELNIGKISTVADFFKLYETPIDDPQDLINAISQKIDLFTYMRK